jgi:polyvinyl alcohol dehydrogenase (cytochrome)
MFHRSPRRFAASLGVATLALGGALLPAFADTTTTTSSPKVSWGSWGGDLQNTHHAAAEHRISPANVHRLAVKWTYETTGNVSAIPTIVDDTLFVPDWGWPLGLNVLPFGGGSMHAIDVETGEARWTQAISSYGGNRVNDTARTTPVVAGDLLIFGDFINISLPAFGLRNGSGATMYAVDRHDGHLVWKTTIDDHPLAVITQSPTLHDGRIYVGVSSVEEAAAKIGYDCCSFRGSMAALDVATGAIVWRTPMTPAGTDYTGVAVWGSAPSIDVGRGVVYIATGNNYTLPTALETCLEERAGDAEAQQRECVERLDRSDNYANAILALDLDTGAVRWARKLQNSGGWTFACAPQLAPVVPTNTSECANPTSQDEDFGQAPMLVTTTIGGVRRDLVLDGQKTGVFYALDADDGAIVWATAAGPGGTQGGMEFGSATDGQRVYVQITNDTHKEYTLVAGPRAGDVVNGGLWAALDVATGAVLWQQPDPSSALPLKGWIFHPTLGAWLGEGTFAMAMGPLTVANGVLFAGSADRAGHMYALDAASGAILWSFESGGSVVSAPTVVDGTVYWGSGYQIGKNNNKLFAFTLSDAD